MTDDLTLEKLLEAKAKIQTLRPDRLEIHYGARFDWRKFCSTLSIVPAASDRLARGSGLVELAGIPCYQKDYLPEQMAAFINRATGEFHLIDASRDPVKVFRCVADWSEELWDSLWGNR